MVKLLTFSSKQNEIRRVGAYKDGKVIDLVEAYRLIYEAKPPIWFYNMKELIEGGDPAIQLVKKVLEDLNELNVDEKKEVIFEPNSILYHPPIENPEKIFLLAANYKAHAQETNYSPPKEPYIFTKFNNTLIGNNLPVIIPKSSEKVDYEIELAVIIGKKGKYINRRDAMKYVFGYTIANDISFRDKQFPTEPPYGMRWVHGKGMDGAFPLGPWIVTSDELENVYNSRLTLKVNGEIRQDAYAEDMIFKIDELIEYLSDGITLSPGDIISTGTPSGVALASGKYLKEGDMIEAEISTIGVLRNPVTREK
ncbi:2-hydroxyhepta-2,4-diene-1,7-dioate isomerase [Sulfolobus sp. A20]|uniref:fumarylacetoacetate hydrolase family protein n=1 Tax=Sulfolobaceae TaxID=118883 RepID=UPI000845CA79|nr:MULTISPECIES: fumarylacetoacetate hydrolase family protein [unclassified Sulfolobus]TRM73892.1 FAA hydrolase family protein [Sulfolobus sp. E5]TRM76189.1 FAA hydrolase family protein [Sulfolobus sp. A20-N-F8]TRM79078.1 FAA hydrolase family protein [Sulfolobus sp. B5]TRM81743.1 FAA hydrolase family protein [Sulfolobus sp. D5]TRM83269.1 FAA hydrolase family protein [Sulfolobus sp. A20-N-F6]TRM85280.1 FAA hydrolase family protein [Sulfolobus sp. F3]TRN01797.1 FAA hydrolase family protein [Su